MKDSDFFPQEPHRCRSITSAYASKHPHPRSRLRPAHALAALWLLLFALLFEGCSSQGSTDYNSTVLREAMTESGATSMTAALVGKEGVLWSESLGDAELIRPCFYVG